MYNFKNKLNSTNASNEDDYDYNYDMKTIVHIKQWIMNEFEISFVKIFGMLIISLNRVFFSKKNIISKEITECSGSQNQKF